MRDSTLPHGRVSAPSTNLHSITQTITNRQDLRAQLWVTYKILIEITQGFGRSLLIIRTNLASNLSAPQKIVTDNHASHAQLWQSEIEIAAIFLLDGVDEDQVESFVETRNNFERVTFFNLSPVAQARPRQITFRSFDHLVAGIDSNNATFSRHPTQHVNYRIANGHPAFQSAPRVNCTGSDFEKESNFPIADRHPMLGRILFHLCEQFIAGWQQVVEIFGLFSFNDCVDFGFHEGSIERRLVELRAKRALECAD